MTTAMKANPVNPVNPVKKNCPNGNYLGGTKRLTQKQVNDIRKDERKKLK